MAKNAAAAVRRRLPNDGDIAVKIVDSTEMQWIVFSEHRGKSPDFKRLLYGDAEAPDNFHLFLVKVRDDYAAPTHRHNFDQIRFILEGSFGFGESEEDVQHAGSVGYFPEGTYYTQRGEGPSLTLLLQIGAGGKQGYMPQEGFVESERDLRERGYEFNKGIVTYTDKSGREQTIDSHQAIWENWAKTKVKFSEPRYQRPVLMNPENYNWTTLRGAKGVELKRLGVFSEYELSAGFVRLAEGAEYRDYQDENAGSLYYVLEGAGALNGERWKPETAMQVEAGETGVFVAAEESLLFKIGLPWLRDEYAPSAKSH